MMYLIRKDALLYRSYFLVVALITLLLVPVTIYRTSAGFTGAVFFEFFFCHTILFLNRQNVFSAKEGQFVHSLPVNRREVIVAKYLFYGLCAAGFAAWMVGILTLSGAISGESVAYPLVLQWIVVTSVGLLYLILLTPLSLLSRDKAAWIGMIVFFMITLLPGRLVKWLQLEPGAIERLFIQFLLFLRGWVLPLLAVAALALCLGSFGISLFLYKRVEF